MQWIYIYRNLGYFLQLVNFNNWMYLLLLIIYYWNFKQGPFYILIQSENNNPFLLRISFGVIHKYIYTYVCIKRETAMSLLTIHIVYKEKSIIYLEITKTSEHIIPVLCYIEKWCTSLLLKFWKLVHFHFHMYETTCWYEGTQILILLAYIFRNIYYTFY